MKRTIRLFLTLLAFGRAHPRRPHIVFIMADDLGWNDVGFHGSDEIPTPNIDALAYSGLILNNYYVEPICTPSRSALMTGRYPIHTGMQHTVLYGAEPRGLPLTEKLLPEYLKDLGYVNRMVGKWHLGSYKRVYTPTKRGFDSHLGCWTGHIDYNDHTAQEKPGWGLDMRRNLEVASDLHGVYVTDLYTNEATRLIEEHNRTKPLFLYLAHNAVHSGNPYNPLAAPDALVANFLNISNYERGKFAAMLTKVDESVGKVVKALEKNGMLEDSVIIFSSDNGGPAAGFNLNAASNWPLKGVKNTLWEGGIRAAGFLWSPLLEKPKRVSHQMMHITDWLPTLYSLAGGNPNDLLRLDGFDLWNELSNDGDSKRETILHNIDDIYGSSSIVTGDWKLIKGTNYEGEWDNWYGPSGRGGSYDVRKIQKSETGVVLEKLGRGLNPEEVMRLRSQADVKCPKDAKETPCWPLESPCLFYLKDDPCERNNLALEYPNILRHLLASLEQYNRTALPPGNLPLDLRGDPKYWSNVWTNFGDYI